MKIVKELLPYLYHKGRLSLKSVPTLKKRNSSKEIPVIVSLTTIESRINIVHLTILSILAQKSKPGKIILWLNENLKDSIPQQLKKLEGEIFEIRYTPYTFSHKKLLHTLHDFPDSTIVTVDDDIMYPSDFLSLLYKTHTKYPNDIITHKARLISFNEKGNLLPYTQWPYITIQPPNEKYVMPVGVFGVLYPPQVFDARIDNIDLIMKLAPKSDDLWFKTMSLLKGTTCRVSDTQPALPTTILGTQTDALKRSNIREDYNRLQMEQLIEFFKITV